MTRIDTAVLTAIRTSIEPRTGFWQFELRPWHYAVAIGGAFLVAVGMFAAISLLGGLR